MSVLANQITIAVPVYKRRQFVKQAVASALNQSIPVRVVVVEDLGPDPTLEAFIRDEFGPRIEYVKSPKWQGQFGNTNLCLDVCKTDWLSILHDDDYLTPGFVEAMIELARQAPGHALYRGQTMSVDAQGRLEVAHLILPVKGDWQRIDLRDLLYIGFPFAGQLLKVSTARELGGFRKSCFFCGDWEMWTRLIARGGGAQTAKVVAYCRAHDAWDRITNAAVRSGRHMATSYVQQKRVLALLPADARIAFDRAAFVKQNPLPVAFLLRYGASLSPRLLAYNIGLFLLSRPPHWRYALFQQLTRLGGARFVKLASKIWNRLAS